jgi:hydroxymethylbilane synthase
LEFREIVPALGATARVGTSSIRRIAQLRAVWPGARFEPIRGNVDTRLRKLDEGNYDALVLAAAGLTRLGLGARVSAPLPLDVCIPAPGQGTIAIEIREDDGGTRRAVEALNDEDTAMALEAERSLVAALGGGCQLPLGALAVHDSGSLDMHGIVVSPDGARTVKARVQGPASDPAALGTRLADELARGGARKILDEVRR